MSRSNYSWTPLPCSVIRGVFTVGTRLVTGRRREELTVNVRSRIHLGPGSGFLSLTPVPPRASDKEERNRQDSGKPDSEVTSLSGQKSRVVVVNPSNERERCRMKGGGDTLFTPISTRTVLSYRSSTNFGRYRRDRSPCTSHTDRPRSDTTRGRKL